jgi:hypothetical protein
LRKLTLTTALGLLGLGLTGQTAQAKRTQYDITKQAVCYFFKGDLCPTAMRIVNCETGGNYTPWSANGQYLGIFQMGSRERATYGHGDNVWAQAKAAYHYFLVAGWSPWLNYEPPGCGG